MFMSKMEKLKILQLMIKAALALPPTVPTIQFDVAWCHTTTFDWFDWSTPVAWLPKPLPGHLCLPNPVVARRSSSHESFWGAASPHLETDSTDFRCHFSETSEMRTNEIKTNLQ